MSLDVFTYCMQHFVDRQVAQKRRHLLKLQYISIENSSVVFKSEDISHVELQIG
jgi:hypothetical protein